jgi:hypothetical protein
LLEQLLNSITRFCLIPQVLKKNKSCSDKVIGPIKTA